MKLYVDDWRPAPDGWRTARTVAEAEAILARGGVEEVSLDYIIDPGLGTFEPVAHFIAQLPPALRPRRVRIHTSSAAGAARLRHILADAVPSITGPDGVDS